MSTVVLDMLNNEERRRYIANHAPGILHALIMRRSSTDPHTLVELAIETCSFLFDAVNPTKGVTRNGYMNGNGRLEELAA